MEIQDGSPDRRLAALSVIDLAEVAQPTVEDWVRTLPEPEANELAGAIPAQRPQADCVEEMRWVALARLGYERRGLPTFLVMLMSTLEALDAKRCPEAASAWADTAEWLGRAYDRLSISEDQDGLDDLSLFVFETYLDRRPLFDEFCALMERHEDLAWSVSSSPALLLGGLPEGQQREALKAAERGGGLPFEDSWPSLQEY